MKKIIVLAVATALVSACSTGFLSLAQERVEPSAGNAERSPVNVARAEHADGMVEAAQKTYASVIAEYELGETLMDNLYVWSRRWLDAELTLIDEQWRGDELRIRASRAEVFRKHLARMEKLHRKVAELHKHQVVGGEPARFFATQFFVAEAKLWVERAGGLSDENDAADN